MVTTANVVERLRPHVDRTDTQAVVRALQAAGLLPKGQRGGKAGTRLEPLSADGVLVLAIALLSSPMRLPAVAGYVQRVLSLRSPDSSHAFGDDVIDGLTEDDVAEIALGTAGDKLFAKIDARIYGERPSTRVTHITVIEPPVIKVLSELVQAAEE